VTPRENPSGSPEIPAVSPHLIGVPVEMWERLRRSGRRLLLLDYDGTLAPFHVHRERAHVPAGTARVLRALAASPRTTVAVVSGRPVAEILRLLGDPELLIYLIGEHGWEEREPGGEIRLHPLSDEASAALEGAWKAIGARGLQSRVEKKRSGLVLHTRGLFPDADLAMQRATEAVWLPWTERAPLRLDAISGGLELRAIGRDKGVAALDLHRRSGDVDLVVYVGDDETDEDAFRALRDLGFGIRVGHDERPTLAHGHLARPEVMDEFLTRWLDSDGIEIPAAGRRE
jgi:trehalose 6-phosphate phosphatase